MNRDFYYYNSGTSQVAQRLAQRDLNKLVTPKQRKKYLQKIFNGDDRDFEKFVTLIKNIKSWKDANILIDFYYYKNGIKPDSKDASDFRGIIYRVYFPLRKGK